MTFYGLAGVMKRSDPETGGQIWCFRTRQGEGGERVKAGDGVQPYPDLGGSLCQHLAKKLLALQN